MPWDTSASWPSARQRHTWQSLMPGARQRNRTKGDVARVIETVFPRRRREVIDALRRGTVPANGLDLLAVGLDHFGPALDAELDEVSGGSAVFKAVRGEYGSGKTFFTRHLAERALRRGWASAEVQVSETDTPTADGLAAWVGGQPHVAAAVKRQAGIRGDLDHFGAMAFLQGLLTVLKAPLGAPLVDAMRRVLLGELPVGVDFSRRATERLDALRAGLGDRVDAERTVVLHEAGETRWWTWVGGRANAVLDAALKAVAPGLCDPDSTHTDNHIALRADAGLDELEAALAAARRRFGKDLAGVEPEATRRAIQGLKFADLLPDALARVTLGKRLADHLGAANTLRQPRVERRTG